MERSCEGELIEDVGNWSMGRGNECEGFWKSV